MKKFLATVFLILSQSVLAADRCESWGCISTVSELYTNHAGMVYVGTPLDETKANCTAHADVYFSLNPDDRNFKEMYSSILAAYMSGSKIQLRVKTGTSKCELSYVRLNTAF